MLQQSSPKAREKLDKVPAKHATHCVAAAFHMLLCKHFFNTKMSQAKCTDLFVVHPEKLHVAVSGWKYDPGKKVPKCKSMEPPLAIQKKQDRPSKEKTETTGPTKKSKTTTTAPNDQSSELDTDDSLPDPFTPKDDQTTQTKVSSKEDLSTEDIQVISSDDNDTPQKTFTSKNPTNIPKTSHQQLKTFSTKPVPQCKQHNK